jgi:hypothetical protein
MINFEIFLIGLTLVSTLTSLVTEAIKKILNGKNKTYCANTLAGIVAAVLSIGIGIGYIVIASVGFSAQSIVCLIALAVASWLCAMVGYDKVVQVINQFKTIKKG